MADEIFRNKKMGDKILIKGRLQNTKNGLCIIAKNIEETNFNVKIKNRNGKMDKKWCQNRYIDTKFYESITK